MISVKEKLVDNKTVIGTFSKFSSPVATEMLGYLGFDFVILDMEHSALDYHQAEDLIRAGEAAGISTVIRVPGVKKIQFYVYWMQVFKEFKCLKSVLLKWLKRLWKLQDIVL